MRMGRRMRTFARAILEAVQEIEPCLYDKNHSRGLSSERKKTRVQYRSIMSYVRSTTVELIKASALPLLGSELNPTVA